MRGPAPGSAQSRIAPCRDPGGRTARWLSRRDPLMVLQLPAAVRVFLCTRPTDMRRSFDALSGLVQECFKQDLLAGHLFLFLNRRRDRIKVLAWKEGGMVIWYKRLEVGTFQQL